MTRDWLLQNVLEDRPVVSAALSFQMEQGARDPNTMLSWPLPTTGSDAQLDPWAILNRNFWESHLVWQVGMSNYKCLCCAKNCATCFISFNPHEYPIREVPLWLLFYRWENWGLQLLNKWPNTHTLKVTEPVLESQVCAPNNLFFHITELTDYLKFLVQLISMTFCIRTVGLSQRDLAYVIVSPFEVQK